MAVGEAEKMLRDHGHVPANLAARRRRLTRLAAFDAPSGGSRSNGRMVQMKAEFPFATKYLTSDGGLETRRFVDEQLRARFDVSVAAFSPELH